MFELCGMENTLPEVQVYIGWRILLRVMLIEAKIHSAVGSLVDYTVCLISSSVKD